MELVGQALGPLLILFMVGSLLGLRAGAAEWASRAKAPVRAITNVATGLMLAVVLIHYGRDMLGAVGSFAIGAQVLCFGAYALGGYFVAPGPGRGERVVLSLAMGTRNIGAAFAPLVAAPGVARGAVVMCAIAVVVTIGIAAVAASCFRAPGALSSATA